jgi:hypothetical protein
VVEYTVRAAVQPVRMRYNRAAQRVNDLLGDVESGDRIGIFPCTWQGQVIVLDDFNEAGSDYIMYDDKKYMVVNADKVPDVDGYASHHWEIGMRLLTNARPQAVEA